jgi:hypothetical protein
VPSPEALQAAPVPEAGPFSANQARPSFLQLHRWQALAALVLLIGAGALALRWWLGPTVGTESVLRRDFVQTDVASGHVEAPHRLDVGVQITGTVLRIPVLEGQAVNAGDLLVSATGVQADSWIKTNAELFTAIAAQNISNNAIRFFVGLSVAFGIASVLAVVVVQKSREIGILRAMGISQGQVMRVFLLQGGLMAFAGSVAGSALGAGVLALWQGSAHSADGTPLFALVLKPSLFIAAVALATVTGLIAALAHARRAARLDPVVAIRG